jgi:adenylate cyclase
VSQRHRAIFWGLLLAVVSAGSHLIGVAASRLTEGLMRGASDLAVAAYEYRMTVGGIYNLLAFPLTGLAVVLYLRPVIAYSLDPTPQRASQTVRRRMITAPQALAGITFVPWLLNVVVFPWITVARFGRWSPELLSQEILSPLISGFLASTTTFLLVELIFRTYYAPLAYPHRRGLGDAGARSIGVTLRLLVLAFTIGFIPAFTMWGLVGAAQNRVQGGIDAAATVAALGRSVPAMLVGYVTFGAVLTLLLARSLTQPLATMAAALWRIRQGDLQQRVPVEANDEVGTLAEGVNELAETLAEREHIMRTFGRVVDPSIRDRLLSGKLQPGGELRSATILFSDLRGFTGMAEHSPPTAVVAVLNRYFETMATRVREHGGFVDKFIGDAMLAVFGLFEDDAAATECGAAAALRCAVGMRAQMSVLNDERKRTGESPLSLGIGIHTGEVVAATLGAQDRYEYTVIGDVVNVAARVQELCREMSVDLLITENARDLARAGGFDPPFGASVDAVLRGRVAPVRVYTVA